MDLVDGERRVQHLRTLSRALQRGCHIAVGGIEEDRDPRQSGDRLLQQLQTLRLELCGEGGQSCDVRIRTRQIGHDAAAKGVADGAHDDGNRRGGLLGGEHRLGAPSENDVHFEADEIIRQIGESLVASFGVAVLEANVLALDVAEIVECLSKGIDGRPGFERQDTDGDYFPRLLRTRRERPRDRRAADKRDEGAPL